MYPEEIQPVTQDISENFDNKGDIQWASESKEFPASLDIQYFDVLMMSGKNRLG